MMHRRDLLKFAAVSPVITWADSLTDSGRAAAIDALLVDRRFERVLQSMGSGLTEYEFNGDVTLVWFEKLEPAWRKPGFELAGITGADALFVLEQLAWDRGRRVVARETVMPSTATLPALMRWIISPVHPSVRQRV